MAQVRGSWPELYDSVEKVFRGTIRDALQELKPIWREVYNVLSSDRKFERVNTITPFGDVPEKPEGEVYALDLLRPGWQKDFTHVEFGLGFEVTQTAMEDDQHDQLVRAAEWLAYSARYVEEKRAARPFNNGFSATGELAPDGKPLFADDHILKGGGTAKNELATAADLSAKSLQDLMIDLQMETKLESGQVVAPMQDLTLYVPPFYEFLADRLLNSPGMPGTADNDRNPIKARRNWRLIVNPHLGTGLGGDDDAWFILPTQKRRHGLTSYTRIPISADPKMVDPFTRNLILSVRFRRSWGAWMWQGLAGSPGA